MARRLRREETVTIGVLAEKRQNHCEIARTLGVTEGTVRYHLRRQAEGAEDGRSKRPYRAERLAGVIEHWFADREEQTAAGERPGALGAPGGGVRLPGLLPLGAAVRARARYPGRSSGPTGGWRRLRGRRRRRTGRSIARVDVGEGPEPLHLFWMTLSHSRRPAAVWSRREDQVSWLSCHNEAYRRLEGVAAVNRIDNVKTALSRGAGAWGTIHPTYRAYAQTVGFHIDACGPREPQAKGKAEAKVRLGRRRLDPAGRRFGGLDELQAWTDERIDRWARTAVCPATGATVHESWRRELERLRPLPILPEPFDVAVTRWVDRDCLVAFEGRQYAVPFALAGQAVEVRGCAGVVQIWAEGRVVKAYPRHTPERLLMDPDCFEGEATGRVLPPPPLGRMGRKLQEIYLLPVEARPVDLYAALAEVAR